MRHKKKLRKIMRLAFDAVWYTYKVMEKSCNFFYEFSYNARSFIYKQTGLTRTSCALFFSLHYIFNGYNFNMNLFLEMVFVQFYRH